MVIKDPEFTLLYLLKILGPTGRQMLKDILINERIAVDGEPARNLLDSINKMERGLGQLDRMSNEERRKLGLPEREDGK